MSRIQKRDGSSVYSRLKADLKEKRTERHREWMDRKLGREPQVHTDTLSSAPAHDSGAKLWADAAALLGMKTESDGQGGYVFSEPGADGDNPVQLKQDEDGILRWELPQAEAPVAPIPTPNTVSEVQLITLADGTVRWLLPGEEMPPATELSNLPEPASDLWKQAGEMLGMNVESNGQGGYLFRD